MKTYEVMYQPDDENNNRKARFLLGRYLTLDQTQKFVDHFCRADNPYRDKGELFIKMTGEE